MTCEHFGSSLAYKVVVASKQLLNSQPSSYSCHLIEYNAVTEKKVNKIFYAKKEMEANLPPHGRGNTIYMNNANANDYSCSDARLKNSYKYTTCVVYARPTSEIRY